MSKLIKKDAAFLKPNQPQIVIVGGGKTAEDKLNELLASDTEAAITLIAQDISIDIWAKEAEHSGLVLQERAVLPYDLKGADLLILATGDEKVNAVIHNFASRHGIKTNVTTVSSLHDYNLASRVN